MHPSIHPCIRPLHSFIHSFFSQSVCVPGSEVHTGSQPSHIELECEHTSCCPCCAGSYCTVLGHAVLCCAGPCCNGKCCAGPCCAGPCCVVRALDEVVLPDASQAVSCQNALHALCRWQACHLVVCGVQLDPQEAQIAALKRELFLLRQENVWLRDQVSPRSHLPPYIQLWTWLLLDAIYLTCCSLDAHQPSRETANSSTFAAHLCDICCMLHQIEPSQQHACFVCDTGCTVVLIRVQCITPCPICQSH